MTNQVKINITGKTSEYFLKELIRRKINLYYIKKESNKIIIIVDYQDYKIIKEIKTTNKISIIEYYGFIKYKNIIKKYYLFFIIIILGIIINIVLSNIIFNIKVIHPNKKLKEMVLNDLSELGLKKYHFKIDYQEKEQIKEELLKKEKDYLEWIEIEDKGTTYEIIIEEKKKNKKTDKCYYRNIVASKKAVIIEVKAEAGEIIKRKNDYVNKGDTIISGFIHNKEDVYAKRCVKGYVYGETWYKVGVIFPKYYEKSKLLNNKKYSLSLKVFDKELNNIDKKKKYKKEEYNIISSNFLPLSFLFSKNQELEIIKKKYTINNVDKYALKVAENKIKKQLNKDESILTKKVLKKQEKNSKIIVDVFFKIKENITEYQDISNIESDKPMDNKE